MISPTPIEVLLQLSQSALLNRVMALEADLICSLKQTQELLDISRQQSKQSDTLMKMCNSKNEQIKELQKIAEDAIGIASKRFDKGFNEAAYGSDPNPTC